MADLGRTSLSPRPLTLEPEILAGRRAFPVTQELYAGTATGDPRTLTCGWHDSSVGPETGAFGLVDLNGGNDDLIGEIVQVTAPAGGSVLVYVLQAVALPVQFSVYRRAWIPLGSLGVVSLDCEVVAVA